MLRLAWLTDIHLNFLDEESVQAFFRSLADVPADAFLLTGDIGEAPNVARLLNELDSALARPIYFVLGNHDFYRGSIAGVRATVESLCLACPNLHWMPREGVVRLTERTCLVGHDGWADGRVGDYAGSDVHLNDWCLIDELAGFDKATRLGRLQALADEAAAHLRSVLPAALTEYEHVIVLTHVPPFQESCWHAGKISTPEWLPHFTCQAVGDALAEAMATHADRQMTVLCGHTHGEGEAQVLPNLRVLTGGAEYGKPKLQRVLAVA
jgi:3',5'-cyclic-AMP phosphodiesterase